MINPKMIGLLLVAFVAGSFVASPELRAYAANTVFSSDIVDGEVKTADLASNAVTAAKVKDGEIKAAEIATDAVGAAELQGVTKLLYGVCSTSEFQTAGWANGAWSTATCTINGAATGDNVMAFLIGRSINQCYDAIGGWVDSANTVKINVRGSCTTSVIFNTAGTISVVVYHK